MTVSLNTLYWIGTGTMLNAEARKRRGAGICFASLSLRVKPLLHGVDSLLERLCSETEVG